jgi:glucose-6-phosphate 1-dehydrogenase
MAMEAPVAFDSQSVRDEKVKVLRALRPVPDSVEDVRAMSVRGQYSAGSSGGKPVPGYLEEPKVPEGTRTETFVGLKMFVDNWRWAGVPFYLRAGKRLPKRVSEVAIQFKTAPHPLFARSHTSLEPNVLSLRIQPDEGISLKFSSKVPGTTLDINPVTMEFRYGSSFGAEPPEAYERLILDCMLGDSTLFTRRDEVELSWEWNTKLLDAWKADERPLPGYEAGSWGPRAADEMLERDGRAWRRL